MSYDEMQRFTSARPFVPFRIHVSDGQVFDVRHPDMVILTRHIAMIGVLGDGGEHLARVPSVALIHITMVEPLHQVAAG